MISDENILRFLYILFFIFFTAFNHILAHCEKIKNKFVSGCPCSMPHIKKKTFLQVLAFFYTLLFSNFVFE